MLNENKHIVSQLTEAFEQKYSFGFFLSILSFSLQYNFSSTNIRKTSCQTTWRITTNRSIIRQLQSWNSHHSVDYFLLNL